MSKTKRAFRDEPPRALKRAVDALGGQVQTAKKFTAYLGRDPVNNPVRQAHVWNWLYRSPFPPELAPAFEAMCAEAGHKIGREQLCPDFPWDAPRPSVSEGRAA